eukprot:CAMPEP_0119152312 /NCGR_PEP_ID=MMETSP1310-20130426/47592_1 /TAXON_ID=464262 /ORGANISM="Genus nov. species nov., Strain RCC2339" /LENGTH=37 /DNA_ID= /DNA_START= /DNA_END= /DNA_ORIENTATION=
MISATSTFSDRRGFFAARAASPAGGASGPDGAFVASP